MKITKFRISIIAFMFLIICPTITIAFQEESEEVFEDIETQYNNQENFFIKNKGQWNENIKYYGKISENNYVLLKENCIEFYSSHATKLMINNSMIHRINLNMNVKLEGKDMLPFYYNYFISNDKEEWIRKVPLYYCISMIEIRSKQRIDLNIFNDRLCISIPNINNRFNVFNQDSLVINEETNQIFSIISSENQISSDKNKFLFSRFTRGKELQLLYSTYIGGNNEDICNDLYLEENGNIIISGRTSSNNFLATNGSFDVGFNGLQDYFIMKFDSNYNLLFSTFFGGSLSEGENDGKLFCSTNSDGDIVVAGTTRSDDFPITDDALFKNLSGTRDGFISKFSGNGSELLFSSYIGGSNDDFIRGFTIDKIDNGYLIFETYSSDFPQFGNPFDDSFNGGLVDGVALKINTVNNTILSTTFLGGSNRDYVYGISINKYSEVFMYGESRSQDFPTTVSPFYNGEGELTSGGFVMKFSSNLSTLLFSALIGGSNSDIIKQVLIDNNNNIIIGGETQSPDFPVTDRCFDSSLGSLVDIFIAVIDPEESSLEYSTFLGGSSSDFEEIISISFDKNENLVIFGNTNCQDFPTTYGSYNAEHSGSDDVFLTLFDYSQNNIIYSTFFGKGMSENGEKMIVGPDENLFCVGYTYSSDLPTSDSSLFSKFQGAPKDGFFIVINSSTPPAAPEFRSYDIGNEFVNLSWEKSVNNGGFPVFQYNIYRSETEEDYSKICSVPYNQLFFNDTSIVNARTYYYQIRAENDVGESQFTEPIVVFDDVNPVITNIILSSKPTTGEKITISARINDNVGIMSAYFKYWFTDSSGSNETFLRNQNDLYEIEIPIQSDEDGFLIYQAMASDFSGNWIVSDEKQVSIIDNDVPVFLLDSTPLQAVTNSSFSFLALLSDNIKVEGVFLEYWNGYFHLNRSMELFENAWIFNTSFGESIEDIFYKFHASDQHGNWLNTDIFQLEMIDNTPPRILSITSEGNCHTGNVIEIQTMIIDNDVIDEVRIEYWFGERTHKYERMEKMGYFSKEIQIPLDSTDDLKYRIHACDVSGNSVLSEIMILPVYDKIHPMIVEILSSAIAETGENYSLSVAVMDNIGVEDVWIHYWFDKDYITNLTSTKNGTHYEFVIEIARNSIYSLNYIIFVSDIWENIDTSGVNIISVHDSIPPNLDQIDDIHIFEGDTFNIQVYGTDNIEVYNISWKGPEVHVDNFTISGKISKKGAYPVTLRLYDEEGNYDETFFTIYVDEKENHTFTVLIIVLLSSIAVIILSLFLLQIYRKTISIENDQNKKNNDNKKEMDEVINPDQK